MQFHIFLVKAALALTACSSAWVFASEISSNELPAAPVRMDEVSTAQELPGEVSDFGVPLAMSELDHYRGGFDVVNNDMQVSGSVANNSAVHVMTGSNYITDGSFANASGFPMVIQNSGANVLIQNATIINVQYQQ